MAKQIRKKSSEKPGENPLAPTWDEKLVDALEPYLPEIGGVGLALTAVVLLLALLGLTDSAWLDPLTSYLTSIAGWGAYALVLLLFWGGLHLALRRTTRPWAVLTSTQIVGLEVIFVAALPLSHLLSGATLPDAYAGRGGGLIGWALATLPHDFIGTLPTYTLYLSLFVWGVALIVQVSWQDVVGWLRNTAVFLRQWATKIRPAPSTRLIVPRRQRPTIDRPRKVLIAQKRGKKQPTQPSHGRAVIGRHPLLPPLDLLLEGRPVVIDAAEIADKKRTIEQTLYDFGLPAKVVSEQTGPAITQFGVKPGHIERTGSDGVTRQQRVRISQITGLQKDLALALKAPRVRIEAPVPGKGIVGIEVPNSDISAVTLRNILEAPEFMQIRGTLGIALGQNVAGTAVATDVARLPHMLVAGQTGSGKSVFMNALITCLVMNNTPDDLHFIMIDPKKVELIRFNGLPHLIGQVETEGERAVGVLRWLTKEMDQRYEKLAAVGARNIASYNEKVSQSAGVKKMPYVIAVIDELADLMVQFGGDVEAALCRLAQMARATGIHLIVATQRPSTDVITGLIKANFPSRVSFAVASGIDSRVILDTNGAENLLGRGDMLYLGSDASAPMRIQGCFVSDDEIDHIVTHWQKILPDFERVKAPWENLIEKQAILDETDELLERAIALTQKYDMVSTSLLQRRLRVGYPRAARLMETLYEMGLVEDPKSGGQTREVYTDKESDDPLADWVREQGDTYREYKDKPDFG